MKKISIVVTKIKLGIILSLFTIGFLLSSPILAQNYQPIIYEPQVTIPVTGSGLDQKSTASGNYDDVTGKMSSDLLARYIKALYDYGMSIAGILAAIVLMGGGILWLTSGGNDSRIAQAKEMIVGSVTGLAILFSSWIILNTINPDLLKLKIITTQVINPNQLPSQITCEWRCVDYGSKCEGGGGHDTIAATSPWRSTNHETCKSGIGKQPSTACPIGKVYDCCCQKKYNVANQEEATRLLACLEGSGKPKAVGSSCQIGTVEGYCKSVSDPQGGSTKIECTPCVQLGEKCDNNTTNYQCSDSSGKCGEAASGDCNSYPTDGNFAQDFIAYIGASTVQCNKINTILPFCPFGICLFDGGQVYIECKCE